MPLQAAPATTKTVTIIDRKTGARKEVITPAPQHTDRAFYPIIGQSERTAALSRSDSLQAKLDKLDTLLAQSSTSAQDAALLAEMLSLPNDGRYPALELTPQQRSKEHSKLLFHRSSPCRAKIRC